MSSREEEQQQVEMHRRALQVGSRTIAAAELAIAAKDYFAALTEQVEGDQAFFSPEQAVEIVKATLHLLVAR